MKEVLSIYKPIGITPLQLIEKFRQVNPAYADEIIGYAGRLDPMAHGVMLLMIGEATKDREQYLALSKTYEFKMLFGVETDTYDLLGYITRLKLTRQSNNVNYIVNSFANKHFGKQWQTYPPFSSKTVQGKPLFWWARHNRLSEITVPQREIEIDSFDVIAIDTLSVEQLKELVNDRINIIRGDFRQEKILERWEVFFRSNPDTIFNTVSCAIKCSSGTYVRQLIHELGKEAGCGAIALDILRTNVGEYTLEKAWELSTSSLT